MKQNNNMKKENENVDLLVTKFIENNLFRELIGSLNISDSAKKESIVLLEEVLHNSMEGVFFDLEEKIRSLEEQNSEYNVEGLGVLLT